MNEETNFVAGTAGGTHVSGAPLTLSNAESAAPGLILNGIDERIVRVRPMSTPIDQLSRCAGARHSGGMKVEYYSVDTKETETTVRKGAPGESFLTPDEALGVSTGWLSTEADSLFEPTETLLLPETLTEGGQPLVLYVLERDSGRGVKVMPVNVDVEADETMPNISKGVRVVRMGRAAAELDVQTAQFSAVPRKASNFCQIFKMQVEQSTFMKMARKEAGWNFSDQEEAAIIDMRLGMEKNFLFGAARKLYDPVKRQEVYFTGGIWGQAPKSHTLKLEGLDEKGLVDLCSAAFVGRTGSKRKILIAGTRLMEALSKIPHEKALGGGETFTKWGIEFKEIRSNFGSLYVLHSEVFDQCGHASDGFILDPDYMTKYVHVPFQAQKLDLRGAGVRNTDAVVLTEASCLVLRYPTTHMRVLGE